MDTAADLLKRDGVPEEIAQMSERLGLSTDKVEEIALEPMQWVEQLQDDTVQEVVAKAIHKIEGYEETFGRGVDWDAMRLALAKMVVVRDSQQAAMAADIIIPVNSLLPALDNFTSFLSQAVARGRFSDERAYAIMDAVVNKLYTQYGVTNSLELLQELTGGARDVLNPILSAMTDAAEFSPKIHTIEKARQFWGSAPWEDIEELLSYDEIWPEAMQANDRQQAAIAFGKTVHTAFSGSELTRKNVEAIKEHLKVAQDGRDDEVWDYLRFFVVVGLYDRGHDNFARGVVRTMNPEKVERVIAFLITDGNEQRAMGVLADMSDPITYGKLLTFDGWSDRAAMDGLIEDITFVASPKAVRKYDPQLRLGTAKGVAAVYAERSAEQPEWIEPAEVMAKRVELLERQIHSGYIKPPARKK